jgi:Arc/MetJ family transcription regulator
MTILLIVAVIFLVLLVGILLAWLFSRLDSTVTTTRINMAAEERAYSPGVTMGHRIKPEADYEEQLKQARKEAAKKAAATPRGSNSKIGRDGQSTLGTAGKSASSDPMTAVRIARFHGWDGARSGIPASGVVAVGAAPAAVAAAQAVAVAAPAIAKPTLIAITSDMAPEEVRKARIANSKAEAAYNKALKAAATGAPVAVAGSATVAAPVAAVPAAPVVDIEPPNLIEITPGMAPEDVRKARVANAKAEAAYNKALKAAGATVGATQPAQPAAPAAPVMTPAAAATPLATGIAPPQLIDITDSLSPEEIRRARVANAKAESAYNKALKAAGLDPAAVKAGAPTAVAAASAPATAVEAAPAESVVTAAPAVPAGIVAPTLIEITDSMSPEEIRRARVENAKASAAYNKALKAAGIDPASLK